MKVEDLLILKDFNKINFDKIREIVTNCPKKRFEIQLINWENYIWATQGHSIKNIQEDNLMDLISEDQVENMDIIHGS